MIHYFVAAALVASQAAAPAEKCLTRQEAGDMALTAMSIALGALTERCRPHVRPDDFLNSGAESMLARLRDAAEPRRASAFAAFARMSRPTPGQPVEGEDQEGESEDAAEQAPPQEESDPPLDFSGDPVVLEGFVRVMAAGFARSLNEAACADANVLVESLSPLTPEHIARIAGAGLGIAGTARPDSTDNPLCPA